MKVLISTDFYINNLGGVTTSILALCAGLRSQGHSVKVLTLSDHRESYRDGDDCFISSVPAYYAPDMRITLDLNDPLIDELIQWRPDIIHVQSEASALLMAKKIQKECNVPLIMTCHTDYAYFVLGNLKNLPPVKTVSSDAGRLFYSSAFKIIVPSRKALNFPFLQAFRERMVVVPNGIELEKHQKALSVEEKEDLRRALGIAKDRKILAAITRISKEKNIQELIGYLPDLLKKVPDATLLIVGEGPYRKHLEDLAEELGVCDRIVFAGRISAQDVWRYYAIADIFVSASVFEVHSMSYLEALAQGLPLLCRQDEALDGVLEHGYNGFAYTSQDEFTDYACRILKDDGLRKSLSSGSLRIVQRFSAQAFAASALRVYEDTIREWHSETAQSGQPVSRLKALLERL